MPVIEVDFTGVTSGAGFLEPGTYRAQVENVARVEGRNYPGLKWTWRSTEPDTLGMQADQFTSLSPKSLWVLKGILEAFGAEIPQSALRFDTDKLIGKKAFVRVINETWTDADGNEHPSSKVDRVMKIPNGEAPGNIQAAPLKAAPAPVGDVDFGNDEDVPF